MNNSNPESIKICPLLVLDSESCGCECLGEHCAWYVLPINPQQEGHCAIKDLGVLQHLMKEVRKV